MSGKQKFLPGDKVFAKVRGYPAWPARIEGSADETPNKMRYHVYFYGTGETGVVKADDIWTFVENKSRFGKPKKPKNFAEAMIQIEAELTPEQLKNLADLEAKEQSGIPNDSIDNDNTRKSVSSKKSLSPTPKTKLKEKKRKFDNDSGAEENEKKKVSLNIQDSDSSLRTPEVMSRSGRKIKPKRFADFEDDGMDENHLKVNNISKVPFTKRDEEFITANVNNEKVEIPISLNKPVFSDLKLEEEWKTEVFNEAHSIKKRLEAGETMPLSVSDYMDQWTNDLRINYNKRCIVKPEVVDVDRAILQNEAHLLELDLSIRGALNIKSADTEKCIILLDKLKDLTVTALMLKKHPDVVQTIKKVRRYIGNVPRAYTEVEEQRFHKNAEMIRQKAEHIYMKFQSLFLVTGSRTFWEVFEEEKDRFDRETKHLTTEELVSMTEEP